MSKADSGRIIHINKQRERTKEDIEKRKKRLEEERQQLLNGIQTKFTTNVDQTEEKLKASTVGLVTLEEMKERQKELLQKADDIITGKSASTNESASASTNSIQPVVQKRVLSFGGFDDEEEEEVVVPKKRFGMNPDVDTSELPDRDREQELIKQKEELAREWREMQEKEKNEEINIAFVYFDGSSHRRDTKMKKGATIGQLLQKATEMFRREFTELRTATTESLMFIKEDLILPHFYTFQDFIATKAMGKTGPLWQFDAAGEIRLRQDAALDSGESHPAKVVLRSWYEKNKHIYPASRWEPFVAGRDYQRTHEDLTKI
ncbi:Protein FAM50-like protein [Aphelenchoides besseyi]|nr:Protein FAM50-like protein [Aphelenchoides besseyi]